ncbi:unnamed protein product, partial [Trichogramma brassicae]
MVILPEDTYERLQAERTSAAESMQTTGDNSSRLDATLFKIMNSSSDDYEKCKNDLQVLRRYLFHAHKERIAAGDVEDDDKNADTLDNEAMRKLARPMPIYLKLSTPFLKIIDALEGTHCRPDEEAPNGPELHLATD